MLVVTRMSLLQVKILMQQQWTYSMMAAMLLNLEDNLGEIRYGIYSHLPYTTSGARVVRLASWSPKTGFTFFTRMMFFPPKFTNFYRSQVNVTALPFPPYWNTIEEKGANGTTHTKYTGTDYLMIESIAKALNFTLYVLPTANWDEVTLRVAERKSFIATIIYAVFPKRLEQYDYSYMFEYAFHAFTMARPALKPQWQSLYYPYTDGVWLFILVVVLIMPVPFILISREGSIVKDERNRVNAGSLLQDIIGTLFGQGMSDKASQSHSSRLLFASWLVFAFIVGTAYRGNLTASLTAPKYPARVETLEQLVTAGARVTMPPYGAHFRDFFKESDSNDFKTLGERVDIVPSAPEGVLQATMKKQAHMEARRYLELIIAEKFTKADGTTSLYIGRESVFPGLSAWPIPHDAPYKDTLNRAIMAVLEGGLYEKWSRDLVNEARQESSKKKREILEQQMEQGVLPDTNSQDNSDITALTVIHMQGPLLLLLLGLVFASLSFVVEYLLTYCQRKDNRA
ncbi:ionotropic receptor 93a-like isoform X1 [Palaemon carinicauda]|uniref:ionotropic receptor 93a-like isoform X1 n=1 Tax=Palaemon carinicauda TaxID=392227 RepID=UPI0035B5EA6B